MSWTCFVLIVPAATPGSAVSNCMWLYYILGGPVFALAETVSTRRSRTAESRSELSPTASKIGSKIGSSSRPDYCFCPGEVTLWEYRSRTKNSNKNREQFASRSISVDLRSIQLSFHEHFSSWVILGQRMGYYSVRGLLGALLGSAVVVNHHGLAHASATAPRLLTMALRRSLRTGAATRPIFSLA